jgi:hypothetical protein
VVRGSHTHTYCRVHTLETPLCTLFVSRDSTVTSTALRVDVCARESAQRESQVVEGEW